MESILLNYINSFPTVLLLIIIFVTLYTLGKGADILVDKAVSLSLSWGISKAIIGATIVSLGTTLPEVTVSVFAALKGNPDLALGNAVGSIITNAGLIIGVGAIIGQLPIDENTINKQGKVQMLVCILLSVVCLPFFFNGTKRIGRIPQWMVWIFLTLLVFYLYKSFRWAQISKFKNDTQITEETALTKENEPVIIQIIMMFLGILIVIISSKILIPCVEVTAIRVGIPQGVIAATLVAFGTSLPELITAITSVRKGHGELAVGNIVGANILNALFVVGSAASVTRKGLLVPLSFYKSQIPTMLIILISFTYFSNNKGHVITKRDGMFLTGIYSLYIFLSYCVI